MKKLNKINLKLDKEVISSLSGNDMNNLKGGTRTQPESNYPEICISGVVTCTTTIAESIATPCISWICAPSKEIICA